MKKEIVEVNKERGIYQITTTDERWYTITAIDPVTLLPYYKFIPSVTWKLSFMPKGIEFYKWLASKGWDEAEIIKSDAGKRGTKIHQAIEKLNFGSEVRMEDKFEDEELTGDEYEAVISYVRFYEKFKPQMILSEATVISEKYNYAGTVDMVGKINGQLWIIDFKTSQYLWDSMKAQLSAYKQALIEMKEQGLLTDKISIGDINSAKLGVLQVGYKRNKNNYKFTEVEDCFESMFLPSAKFWDNVNSKTKPRQVDLPIYVKLDFPKKEDKKIIIKKNESNIKTSKRRTTK